MSRPKSRTNGVPGFRSRYAKIKRKPPLCKICGGKVPFDSAGGHGELCLACYRDEQRTCSNFYEWQKHPRVVSEVEDDDV